MDKTEPFFGHFLVDPLLMALFLRDDDILDTFLQKQFYFIAVLLYFFLTGTESIMCAPNRTLLVF